MTTTIACVYDFNWDADATLGVWVGPDSDIDSATLVEAAICEVDPDADADAQPWEKWQNSGEYELASRIELHPDDGLWLDGADGPVWGAAAARALAGLQAVERDQPQIPVNEQQREVA